MAGAVTRLRAVRRIGFPLYRRDIWIHVFGSLPLLVAVTWKTWHLWHPEVYQILSENAGFSLWSRQQHLASPAVFSMLDAAAKLHIGAPLLFPLDAVSVDLVEPLLASNNTFLMIGAAWALGIIALVISLLLPSWSAKYKFWAFYKEVPSLELADSLLISDDTSLPTFCSIKQGSRYCVVDGVTDKSRVQSGPVVEYKSKLYLISSAEQHPERAAKYQTTGTCKQALVLLPPQYDVNKNLGYYADAPGLNTRTSVFCAERVFGKNQQDIPIPEFLTLFLEHAVQPLFVFQVFSMLLWLLDEYWQYSMLTLGILVMFEGQMVMRRRRDLAQIKSMHMPPTPVLVRRLDKWYKLSSVDLLPGDVFSLALNIEFIKHDHYPLWPNGSKLPSTRFSGEEQSIGVPCDAVILSGSCVVNEAMLTGESLPQMKSGLTSVLTEKGSERLTQYDMANNHKAHTLYAGTGCLAETGSGDFGGATLFCLRTGFQTTQGKLIRTVLHSAERSTGSSREALLFLLILTVVAFVASGYVLYESWGLPNRNHYKLLLHCVMIITSVVPPELPVTMSLTVTTSVNALFKKKLYCTEPFRLPPAGKLTYCCFDKTGTLTTSDVLLEQIVSPKHQVIENNKNTPLTTELNIGQALTMGCCNSLVCIRKRSRLPAHMRVADGKKVEEEFHVVGDPLEKTAAASVGWQPEMGRQDRFMESSGKRYVEVLKRFPFASELQRMTSVITLQQERAAPQHYVVCKGAAERIATLARSVPDWYESEVNELALKGRRVLAIAYKAVSNAELADLLTSREKIEAKLDFGGLLVYGCPIKYKTVETIQVLRASGHATVMITGDDFRTAVHIAKEVSMVNQETAMWTISGENFPEHSLRIRRLEDANEEKAVQVTELNTFLGNKQNGLVVLGKDLELLSEATKRVVIPLCNVFARVTPAQKEMILRTLKALDETTLMCGDGTNDVGALKAADVGVSLLNFDLERIKERKKEKTGLIKMDASGDKCRGIVIEPVDVSRKRRLSLGLNARQIQQLENMEKVFIKQRQQLDLLSQWMRNKTIPALYQNIVNAEERMAQNNLAMASGANAPPPGGPLASLFAQAGSTAAPPGADDFDDGQPLLRPGDASMASPFTYRGQSIKCVKLLIKMGKATLATVMMNYRLMALNSLTSAFSLSVLTLHGVKYGDAQVTAESLFVSVLYMCVGNAAAAKTITQDRVVDSLFDPHFYVSIILQAAVHILTCGAAWWLAIRYDTEGYRQMDGPFKPNLVNTAVFLVGAAQHASTFLGNYEGAPFLKSWGEFKILSRTLVAFIVATFFVAFEISPELNALLKLVPMPTLTFRFALIGLMLVDIVGASGVGLLSTMWGRRKKTKLRSRI